MRKIKYLHAIIFLSAIFLQSLLHRTFPFLIGLDLYTIFVYFISKRTDLRKSMIIGTLSGIFEDFTLSYTIPIGANGISKLIVAILSHHLTKVLNSSNLFVEMGVIYFISIVDKLTVIFIFYIFGISFHFSKLLIFVISPITNAAFYLIFFLIANLKWKE